MAALVRRQMGRRLRTLREQAGLVREDSRLKPIASRSKLETIEAGRAKRVGVADVIALCRIYGASEEQEAQLIAMAESVSHVGYGEESDDLVVPEWFGLFADLETSAREIRSYQGEFVPGLLQTEEYARAIIASDARLASDVVERRVEFRKRRQAKVLDGSRKITMLLSEAALRRVVGSTEVMSGQVQRLVQLTSDGTVGVRVLPFLAGAYPQPGDYVLLTFAEGDDPDPPVAYVELPLGARYMERPEQLMELNHHFDALLSKSVSIEEFV